MDITSLLPRIQAQLVRCPEDYITLQLRATARRFCQDTDSWREDLDTIATVADQADYDLEAEHEYDATIRRVRLVTIETAEQCDNDWKFSVDGVLTLLYPPAESGLDLDVSVSFLPELDAGDHPDFLVDRWAEALILGTLAELKAQVGSGEHPRPWFDERGAIRVSEQYWGLVTQARQEQLLERKSGNMQISIPPLI